MRIQGVKAGQILLALDAVDMSVPAAALELATHVVDHGPMAGERGVAVGTFCRRTGRALRVAGA